MNNLSNLLILLFLYAILAFAEGCGNIHNAKANGTARAQYIPGPAGVSCFGIIDEQGRTVGGNCL